MTGGSDLRDLTVNLRKNPLHSQLSVLVERSRRQFQCDVNTLFISVVLQGILVINIFIWVCLWFWKSTSVYNK